LQIHYDLEEKFISREGICPKNNNTLEMNIHEENDNDDFGASNDIGEQGEGEDGPNTTRAGIEPRTPATPYCKKPAASNKSSKGKSKRAKSSVSTNNVDYMIASLCKIAMEKNNRQNTKLVQKVELAENYEKMSDALGSKIKAAYQCKEFVVLLDKKEKMELKIYAKSRRKTAAKTAVIVRRVNSEKSKKDLVVVHKIAALIYSMLSANELQLPSPILASNKLALSNSSLPLSHAQ
jgi:hypothetical protein